MKKSSKSDARFRRYRLKRPFFSQKGGFWGQKPAWGANENFFQKSAWNIFLDSSRCSFVQKNHQNLMRGFLDMPSRTHGRTHARTDGRTDKRESIGLSAEAERPKNSRIVNFGPIFTISKFSQQIEFPYKNRKI